LPYKHAIHNVQSNADWWTAYFSAWLKLKAKKIKETNNKIEGKTLLESRKGKRKGASKNGG